MPKYKIPPSTVISPVKIAPLALIGFQDQSDSLATAPVADGVFCVVPKEKYPIDSSQIKAALSPLEPLSIMIPESLALVPVKPLFKPIILSDTSKFVWLTVVVVPLTVKLPPTVTLPVVVIASIYASFQYKLDEPKS